MASEVMDGADVCPTEDAVAALLEFLVDPRLPVKSSTCHTPAQSDEESVAKQVYAAVLLYNFFHRKQHPELEILGFESFCKLAVVLRPALLAYMNFMKISNDAELVDAEKQLSLTEKKIMDACDISMNLINASSTQGWPISKVAVLLVDSTKENFFLQFSSITDGVWSLIEKDLDSKKISVDTLGLNNTNKRRRIVRRSVKTEPAVDESNLQQLAFSSVIEATGISQNDLTILESSVVYSLSKEKAATSFYIMQCTQPNNDDIILSIKDVIQSLQGPLFKKNSGGWTHTSVVEYFHLLPYAGTLSNWLSKEGIPMPVQVLGLEMLDKNIIKITDELYEGGFLKRCDKSHEKGNLIDCHDNKGTLGLSKQNDDIEKFGSNLDTGLLKVNDDNDCPVFAVLSNAGMPNVEESSGSTAALTKNEDSGVNNNLVQSSDLSKLNSTTNDDKKAELIDTVMEPVLLPEKNGENATDGNDTQNVMSLDQEKKLAGKNAAFDHESNGDDLDKVHTSKCSKDKGLSETLLRVFTRKRKRLVNDDKWGPVFGAFHDFEMPNVEEGRDSSAVLIKHEDRGGNIYLTVKPGDLSKLNSATNGDNKAELIDTIREPVPSKNRGGRVADGSCTVDIISSDPDTKLACYHDAVSCESNLGKVQTRKWSKNKDLSETVLRVFFRKRDRLSLQQRDIEDQIAQCDKIIQTILKDGEDELMNNIESIIEGCNDGCPTDVSVERVHQRHTSSPQCIKKRLPGINLDMQNPCQDLDDLCYENDWVLPTYNVSVIKGGFRANVHVKGTDFERSTEGEGCSSHPQQARASAAKKILARLQKEEE